MVYLVLVSDRNSYDALDSVWGDKESAESRVEKVRQAGGSTVIVHIQAWKIGATWPEESS